MASKTACECGGDISASQEDALAASPFLGAAPLDLSQQQQEEGVEDMVTMCTLPSSPSPSRSPPPAPSLGAVGHKDDDGDEVLADLPQQQHKEEEEATLPSTPSSTRSPSPPRRKPRVCVRKVRVRGAKIRTPTPSPDLPPAVEPQPQPAQPTAPEQAEQQPHADADPLYRAVQMVGALTDATATARSSSSSNENAVEDFLALARRRGLL